MLINIWLCPSFGLHRCGVAGDPHDGLRQTILHDAGWHRCVHHNAGDQPRVHPARFAGNYAADGNSEHSDPRQIERPGQNTQGIGAVQVFPIDSEQKIHLSKGKE